MEEKRTVSIPEAGKWLGIGRNAAYEASGDCFVSRSWRWNGSWK
jgi:hypothetical protein